MILKMNQNKKYSVVIILDYLFMILKNTYKNIKDILCIEL